MVCCPAGEVDSRHADVIRSGAADSARRNLHARAFDHSLVDGIAHVNVAVTFAVRSDIARGRESGAQIGSRVLDGDDGPGFLGRVDAPAGREAVIHVRVAVDQSGQDGGLAEIDNLRAVGNFNSIFRADIGDSLALDQDDLFR